MPVYTYHCENCGHEFDRRQNYSDNSLRKCPNCNKLQLRKVYNPARVVFKGSGYYSTDNKSSARSKSNSANGKAEKKEKSNSTKKTDTKNDSSKKEKSS